MKRRCQCMDSLAAAAYVKTDLEINATFYKIPGFSVTRHELVLGMPNSFLSCSPSGTSANAIAPPDE